MKDLTNPIYHLQRALGINGERLAELLGMPHHRFKELSAADPNKLIKAIEKVFPIRFTRMTGIDEAFRVEGSEKQDIFTALLRDGRLIDKRRPNVFLRSRADTQIGVHDQTSSILALQVHDLNPKIPVTTGGNFMTCEFIELLIQTPRWLELRKYTTTFAVDLSAAAARCKGKYTEGYSPRNFQDELLEQIRSTLTDESVKAMRFLRPLIEFEVIGFLFEVLRSLHKKRNVTEGLETPTLARLKEWALTQFNLSPSSYLEAMASGMIFQVEKDYDERISLGITSPVPENLRVILIFESSQVPLVAEQRK